MRKKVSFLRIVILLILITKFSIAANAQGSFRIARPGGTTYNTNQNFNSPPISNTNAPANINDSGSDFRLNLPQSNSPAPNQIKLGAQYNDMGSTLTQVQLQKLAAHDIILIIDKSGSMSTPDCPTSDHVGLKSTLASIALPGIFSLSRWQWCQRQISQLSLQTQQVLPEGFTVLLFDSNSYLFPHVNSNNLIAIFATHRPSGSTNLTLPLDQVFSDYFRRLRTSPVKIKPLLIGIITDGCPDNPNAVKRQLVAVTHSLQNANDITIIFFLIGTHDAEGERFARHLSQDLLNDGAAFNIVKYVPFDEVLRTGLVKSLADHLD